MANPSFRARSCSRRSAARPPTRVESRPDRSRTDGSFTLTTFDSGDGAVVGQHTVTVEARGSGEDMKKMNMKPGGVIAYKLPKAVIPEKYTKTTTTPLKQTVEASGNNFSIELTD